MQRLKGYWLTKMEAKVLQHLDERKTPRSAKQMAEYFGVSAYAYMIATAVIFQITVYTFRCATLIITDLFS